MAATTNNTTVVMAGGYAPPPTTTVIVQNNRSDNACRAAIPAMHIGMAIFCLILNIFVPGTGTIFAGFSVFCCANKGQDACGKVGTLCINFWVGNLQAGLVWCLIGWIWSIMWGAAFLGMSEDYHRDDSETTVITTQAAPPPMPMVITTTTSSAAAAPAPAPAPPLQQYPPTQQQPYPPPPAYEQPGTSVGIPGQVQQQKY